jgi:DNA-directed RNA polymerase specialized sigma24 family protein
MQVKMRDHWLCRNCGTNDKDLLDAHHIEPKKDFPELAHDVENGKTLCMLCHAKEHIDRGEIREAILILLRLFQVLMKREKWPKITYRDREAFRMVEMQGLTIKETSRLMGCSRRTVTRSLNKIKKYYPHLQSKKGDFKIITLPSHFENFIRCQF